MYFFQKYHWPRVVWNTLSKGVGSLLFLLLFSPAAYANDSPCFGVNTDIYSNIFHDTTKSFQERFEEVKDLYHTETNEAFNENIELLAGTSYKEAPKDMQKDLQKTDLPSFYAERNEEYKRYICALQKERENITSESVNTPVNTMYQLLIELKTNEQILVQEQEQSRAALDLSLQMYSGMRLYAPLHMQLETLITELHEYRDAVRDFVGETIKIASNYVNFGSKNAN